MMFAIRFALVFVALLMSVQAARAVSDTLLVQLALASAIATVVVWLILKATNAPSSQPKP